MIKIIKKDNYAIIQLAREKELNAINAELMAELNRHLDSFAQDNTIKVIILTGTEKAFAAGVDITEMSANHDLVDASWRHLADFPKPVIAAVSGYAFGGGCELAQMCDIIIAADNAKFAQPEIKLGILPGMGGTKMLRQYVGKSIAMQMCLTGDPINAQEALQYGLVSKVVPFNEMMDYACKIAQNISRHSLPVLRKIKHEINNPYKNLGLDIESEFHAFKSCFDLDDQSEGFKAFLEKRQPKVTDK